MKKSTKVLGGIGCVGAIAVASCTGVVGTIGAATGLYAADGFNSGAPSALTQSMMPDTGSDEEQSCEALTVVTGVSSAVADCIDDLSLTDGQSGTCTYRWGNTLDVDLDKDGNTSAVYTDVATFGLGTDEFGMKYTESELGSYVAFDDTESPAAYGTYDEIVGITRDPVRKSVSIPDLKVCR
jgi:hypothetical protein